MNAISQTHFQLPQQTAFYRGKVRDVYTINNTYLVMVVSDRISAFDVVLPKPIPYKGQVLNQIAAKFLQATSHIVPNWVIAVPDPNVTIGRMCTPFKVEMVIRGYLAGHAYREYAQGKRTLCGVTLPDGLKENDPFPTPIITPTTKESVGHDEDISKEKILELGIVTPQDYEQLEKYTYALFKKGTEMAAERGLILVDTKYEFGKTNDGKIFLIDEIHTPDSSRYFYKEGYEERQKNGEKQKQLSKEFVREWLIANNFQGKEGQQIPEMTDEIISDISERYIELYEKIIGENFQRADISTIYNRIENNILKALSML
ncbi:MAG: phosphoribosylaminoimidazolesuccinocarboxamide synthase [Flavobacteriales bacterium]|nr:phosphoribosylaminoimidazolesuccinocarboxamide synthase [Flavobacteriales bacterium]